MKRKAYTLNSNITGTFILTRHMHRVHVCTLKKISIQQKFVILDSSVGTAVSNNIGIFKMQIFKTE